MTLVIPRMTASAASDRWSRCTGSNQGASEHPSRPSTWELGGCSDAQGKPSPTGAGPKKARKETLAGPARAALARGSDAALTSRLLPGKHASYRPQGPPARVRSSLLAGWPGLQHHRNRSVPAAGRESDPPCTGVGSDTTGGQPARGSEGGKRASWARRSGHRPSRSRCAEFGDPGNGPMKETAQAARYNEADGSRPGTTSQVGIPSRRNCLTGGA